MDTAKWKEESQVIMNMTNTLKNYKVVWEDDIPVLTKETNPEWDGINWKKLEKRLFKLQKRIFQAAQKDDIRAVRKIQKTLLNSWTAKCLAVRKVTQENQGKNTAGVDGRKRLTPPQRMKLVKRLRIDGKTSPVRRVWIPKPGKSEKRPLGIPTIEDRAKQALLKLALEPEWEARFEPNSYGFRPGKSAHDAIAQIRCSIHQNPKYVLDADIAQCFDEIDHSKLLKKLNTFPRMRRQIKAWLKAKVFDKEWISSERGTPQGGVVSPLLANIALHGLENELKQLVAEIPLKTKKGDYLNRNLRKARLCVVRYADDFVIMHEDLAILKQCKERLEEWLKDIGLKLKPSKTRLTHTLLDIEGEKAGFNFLGFFIKQETKGRHHSARNSKGETIGFTTLVKPSKEAVKQHYQKISAVIDKHRASPQWKLIKELNPIITGWANYFAPFNSSMIFSRVDNLIYLKLSSWAKQRHSNNKKRKDKRVKLGRSTRPVWTKYWKISGNRSWDFRDTDISLRRHTDKKCGKYVKVIGAASPYDGNLSYWGMRMAKNPLLTPLQQSLLKKQKGRCNLCGNKFQFGDKWEIDHITPKKAGGSNKWDNRQLLHKHCHHLKTKTDLKNIKQHKLGELAEI